MKIPYKIWFMNLFHIIFYLNVVQEHNVAPVVNEITCNKNDLR